MRAAAARAGRPPSRRDVGSLAGIEPQSNPVTRAAARDVDPGNDAVCVVCHEQIRFAARSHQRQVIANVYEDGVWQRVDHYHEDCYREVGEPFGQPSEPMSRAERAAERARAAERRSGES